MKLKLPEWTARVWVWFGVEAVGAFVATALFAHGQREMGMLATVLVCCVIGLRNDSVENPDLREQMNMAAPAGLIAGLVTMTGFGLGFLTLWLLCVAGAWLIGAMIRWWRRR